MDSLSINHDPSSGNSAQPADGDVQVSGHSAVNVSRVAIYAALLLLIILAFALRIYALERQSMWSDEGLSYYRATLSAADVLKGLIVIDGVDTRDTNPPLYFLLLHFWRNLTGDSIFSLRYSGVLAGTLAVPLMFVLGSAIYGRWVGLAAALLMAISPFHVWQSQVLRNYSLLVTFNLASVYGLFRYVLAAPGQVKTRWFLLWLLAGLLGIYTHYFGFFVFAFGVITLFFVLAQRWQIDHLLRQKRFWAAAALFLLILLPAVVIGLDRFQAGQQIDFHQIGLVPVLIHAASAFGVGISPSLAHPWWKLLPALILALAGLAIGWRRRWQPTTILLGYQLIPIGIMLLLSMINPLYNGVRHLLIGLPPFLLFVANGAFGTVKTGSGASDAGKLRTIVDWLRLLLFIVVIIIQLFWLHTQFTDDELLRDDVRGPAEYLSTFAEADDLIILHDTIIGLTFDYYYDGAAEWRAIPPLYEQNVAVAQADLMAASEEGQRIWFLARPTPRTGFPRKELWEWADEQWPRFFDREYPSMWLRVQLVGYDPEPVIADLPEEAAVVDETFGESLQLHGVEIPETVKAGEPWWATLYWSKLDKDAGEVSLSLRFVDEVGQLWGQVDPLLWYEYPPDQWQPGTIISNDHEFSLASGMPPGEYEIWLRVLDGERRPLRVNDNEVDAFLGQVELLAGTEISGLPPIFEQNARLGEIDLLGYTLPADEIKPGHALPIDLFWRIRQTPTEDYRLRIELIDQAGDVISVEEGAPSRVDYPASYWQSGEILQSKMLLNVPASADETPHSIRVGFIAPSTGEPIAAVTLADKLLVDPWPFTSELPLDMEPLDAEFGDPADISLQGFELASSTLNPGDLVDLTLYWQSYKDVSEPYYVFIHLMAEDDSISAQVDSAPVQGFRPTVSWRAGEVIKDDYAILLGADMLPGKYQLWAGLYNPDTWERPLTTVDGQNISDMRVFLGEITVGQPE